MKTSLSVPSLRREVVSDAHSKLVVLDFALCAAVITPAVIVYWRVTWALFDIYLLPAHQQLSVVASLCIGFFGVTLFTLAQHRLDTVLHSWRDTAGYYVITRSYTALFGCACINSWRGIWETMDLFTGSDPAVVAATVVLAFGTLIAMGTLRNVVAPPVSTLSDHYHGYFEVPTLFRLRGQRGTGSFLYVLDSFFSVCIIGSLVVIVWRGVWNIMDEYLYPDMQDISAWLSLAIGYGVVLIAFALQPTVKSIVKKVRGIKRMFIVDTYLLFSFFGAVNVWRGIWTMLDVYFLPDAPMTSYWISHIACFAILVALNSSNSILVRGVYMDAEEDGTQCVDFPCYYFRLLVQKRKRKKTRNAEQEGKEMIQIKVQPTDETTETVTGKLLSSSTTNENGGVITSKMNGDEAEDTLPNNNKIV
ncbi:uncharacterized protein LOC126847142 isoform X2 [Adelges cooleyi]|uniref:uncharacterized protein LOC126847142 isoform X2 n=1 Tax=Adelges cooleyi TaxID=133065 RepID=UPI00217F3FAA|nr:uncharacterized protein LOC126847142 isoform X2 [Adelges cooleyi]